MQLTGFQVTDFRSVKDSGWIDVQRIAALIGINESGKTNLLVPLWKLNPAREGQIQPTADYPKKLFGTIRANPGEFCFITAEFHAGELAQRLADEVGVPAEQLHRIRVRRYFDDKHHVEFPDAEPARKLSAETIADLIGEGHREIGASSALAKESALKQALMGALDEARDKLPKGDLDATVLTDLLSALKRAVPEETAKTSAITPRYSRVLEAIEQHVNELNRSAPGELEAVFKAVMEAMPRFVYYSNYGNLDSEIYLPHVVQNLRRTDLGAKEADKARTLRVLFRFVQLSPEEILELGRDFRDPQGRQPSEAEITAIAEKKRVRSILLQSASATLTSRFRDWWKQGDYRFRFEADGDHFRIWVSDDRRPEEVELESRSSGLQWFLSFYLVFLVESEAAHRNAVLLLDEPGLSLHPLAQRDLSEFFEGLAGTNQILYTTHSPFLVDADHLDRARKVYVSDDGTTKATGDLRQGAPNQAGASYAVYSALNLSVAEGILLGCQPIIVEGPSDQHYLTAIKALLIGAGEFSPKRELVFPPSGGARTARVTASILTGRDEKLPTMLLDDDAPGRQITQELKNNLYADAPERLLSIATYTGMAGSEVEDLFPISFTAEVVDRWERRPDEPFADVAVAGKPAVGQIEAWMAKHGVKPEKGWKVELAKRLKQLALDRGIQAFATDYVARWRELFSAFE